MDEVAALRAEIEGLRSRLRVLGWSAAVGGVVLAGLFGTTLNRQAPVADRLVAREVAIVDADGVVRARLGTSGLGDASLSLHDPAGKGRIWLDANTEHATLRLTDPGQRTLARLSTTPGLTGLHLARAEGAQTVQLQASGESTSLMLADLDRALVALLRADPGGTELQLNRTPTGGSPTAASLSAGGDVAEKGAALMLVGRQQYLEASVHPDDGEPRVVLAGETRLSSSTRAGGDAWSRAPRPGPSGE